MPKNLPETMIGISNKQKLLENYIVRLEFHALFVFHSEAHKMI